MEGNKDRFYNERNQLLAYLLEHVARQDQIELPPTCTSLKDYIANKDLLGEVVIESVLQCLKEGKAIRLPPSPPPKGRHPNSSSNLNLLSPPQQEQLKSESTPHKKLPPPPPAKTSSLSSPNLSSMGTSSHITKRLAQPLTVKSAASDSNTQQLKNSASTVVSSTEVISTSSTIANTTTATITTTLTSNSISNIQTKNTSGNLPPIPVKSTMTKNAMGSFHHPPPAPPPIYLRKAITLEEIKLYVTRDIEFCMFKKDNPSQLHTIESTEDPDPLHYCELIWSMNDDELKESGYELLLTSSRLLTDLNKEDVETVLGTIRTFLLQFNSDLHEHFMLNLMINIPKTSQYIPYQALNGTTYIKKLTLPSPLDQVKFPEDLKVMKHITYRLDLLKFKTFEQFSWRSSSSSQETAQELKWKNYQCYQLRNAKFFYNAIVLLMNETKSLDYMWNISGISNQDAMYQKWTGEKLKSELKTYLIQFLSVIEQETKKLHPNLKHSLSDLLDKTDQDKCKNIDMNKEQCISRLESLLKDIYDEINFSVEYDVGKQIVYPLNVLLYQNLVGPCIVGAIIGSNLKENEFEDDEDSNISGIDRQGKIMPIFDALKCVKKVLDMEDLIILQQISLSHSLYQLHDSFNNAKCFRKLTSLLISQLYRFDCLSSKELKNQEKKHLIHLYRTILHNTGSLLCDYYQHYCEDIDSLQIDAKIYSIALDSYCLNKFSLLPQSAEIMITEFEEQYQQEETKNKVSLVTRPSYDEILSSCFQYMIRSSVKNNYDRIKEDTVKKVEQNKKKEQKLNESLASYDDNTEDEETQAVERLNFFMTFCKELREEMDSSSLAVNPMIQVYYQEANAEVNMYFLNLLVKDISQAIKNLPSVGMRKEISNILNLVRELCGMFAVAENEIEDQNLTLRKILEPLSSVCTPHLDDWVNQIQQTFHNYLERMMELEKWESISNKMTYSSSVIDLFSFLDQSTPMLSSLFIPRASIYFRAIAQCASGMVQKYTMNIVDEIPANTTLLPEPFPMKQVGRFLSSPLTTPNTKKSFFSIFKTSKPSTSDTTTGSKTTSSELITTTTTTTQAINLTSEYKKGDKRQKVVKKYATLLSQHTKQSDLFGISPAVFYKHRMQNRSKDEKEWREREEQRLEMGQKYQYKELFIRLNNLTETRKRLVEMIELMRKKWKEIKVEIFRGSNTEIADVDFDNILQGTQTFISSLVRDLCYYIGCRIVFVELYDPIFEELYVPSVQVSNFQPYLDKYLDPCLQSICDLTIEGNCIDNIIKSICKNLMLALMMVILDGGPKRIFHPEDTSIMLKDIELIENFFHADGQGINSLEYVHGCTSYLRALMTALMTKSSIDLIEGNAGIPLPSFQHLKANTPSQFFAQSTTSTVSVPASKQTVYKILYHRNDAIAKKFVKNHPFVYYD